MSEMQILTQKKLDDPRCVLVDVSSIDPGITEDDERIYNQIITTELTPEQVEWIVNPEAEKVHPEQQNILAAHWHPEFVPMDLIRQRIRRMYPNAQNELIIPTQHNILMTWDGYSGVEVDCFSSGFNRKTQLLLHFNEANTKDMTTLLGMCEHTFKYRTGQLFDFMHSVVSPDMDDRVQRAAHDTNTDEDIVAFARLYTSKLQTLVKEKWSETPREVIKNKLLRNFIDMLRPVYGDTVVNKTQVFLKAVKAIVKENFSLKYFYRATEFIEEARLHNAGVVIPHPEQFWPILLSDYDVDGIEVWNPQSQEYTEFLIRAVMRQNEYRKRSDRPLLIFMGDDCHMSEKTKTPETRDAAKAAREIGYQPGWDDLVVRKSLIMHGVNRAQVIEEYRARLDG